MTRNHRKKKRSSNKGKSKDLKAKSKPVKAGSRKSSSGKEDVISTILEDTHEIVDKKTRTSGGGSEIDSQREAYASPKEISQDKTCSFKYDLDFKKYVNDIVDEDHEFEDTFFWQNEGERQSRKNCTLGYPWVGLKSLVSNSLQHNSSTFNTKTVSPAKDFWLQDMNNKATNMNYSLPGSPLKDHRNISPLKDNARDMSTLEDFKDPAENIFEQRISSTNTTADNTLLKRQLLTKLNNLVAGFESLCRKEFLRGYVGHIERLENRVKAMMICPQLEKLYLKQLKSLLMDFKLNPFVPLHHLIVMNYRLETVFCARDEYQYPLSKEKEEQEILLTHKRYREEKEKFLRLHPELGLLLPSIEDVEREHSEACCTNTNIKQDPQPSPACNTNPFVDISGGYHNSSSSEQTLLPGIRDIMLQAQKAPRPACYNLFEPLGSPEESAQKDSMTKVDEAPANANDVLQKAPPNVTALPSSYTSFKCTARPLSNIPHTSYSKAMFDRRICRPDPTQAKTDYTSPSINDAMSNKKIRELSRQLPNRKTDDALFTNFTSDVKTSPPMVNFETRNNPVELRNPFENKPTFDLSAWTHESRDLSGISKPRKTDNFIWSANNTPRSIHSPNNIYVKPTWGQETNPSDYPPNPFWSTDHLQVTTDWVANNTMESNTWLRENNEQDETSFARAQSSPQQMSGDVARFFRQYESLYSNRREAATAATPPIPWTYTSLETVKSLDYAGDSVETLSTHEPTNAVRQRPIPYQERNTFLSEPKQPNPFLNEPKTPEDPSPGTVSTKEYETGGQRYALHGHRECQGLRNETQGHARTRRQRVQTRGDGSSRQETRRSKQSARSQGSRKKLDRQIPCKILTKKMAKDKVTYKILTRGKTLEDFILESGDKPVSPKLRPASVRKKLRPGNRSSQQRATSSSLSIRYISSWASGKHTNKSSSPDLSNPTESEHWRNEPIEEDVKEWREIPRFEKASPSESMEVLIDGFESRSAVRTAPCSDTLVDGTDFSSSYKNRSAPSTSSVFKRNKTVPQGYDQNLDKSDLSAEVSSLDRTTPDQNVGDRLMMAILRSADDVKNLSSEPLLRSSDHKVDSAGAKVGKYSWGRNLWKHCKPDVVAEDREPAASTTKRKAPTFDCLARFKANLARRLSISSQPETQQQANIEVHSEPITAPPSKTAPSLYKGDKQTYNNRSTTPTTALQHDLLLKRNKPSFKPSLQGKFQSRSSIPSGHKSQCTVNTGDKMKLALNEEFDEKSLHEVLKQFHIFRHWEGVKSERQLTIESLLKPRVTFKHCCKLK